MASLMRQLQSKASVATDIATKRGTAYYKQLLEENKKYIQDPPTVQKCQELSKQLFYTRLARFFTARSIPALPIALNRIPSSVIGHANSRVFSITGALGGQTLRSGS